MGVNWSGIYIWFWLMEESKGERGKLAERRPNVALPLKEAKAGDKNWNAEGREEFYTVFLWHNERRKIL